MKNAFLLFCLAVLLICPAFSQEKPTPFSPPPTVQQVMKFFEVMHLSDQMKQILDAQRQQMKIMTSDMFTKDLPEATPEQKAKFQKLMDDIIADFYKQLPIDDMLRDMVPVYQRHLTEADLNATVAFYSSPAGQKILREMPAMTQEAMRVSYTRIQPLIQEMMKTTQARVQKMVEEEKAASQAK